MSGARQIIQGEIVMRILQQCFRVYAETKALEASIQFYEQLQGVACERRVVIPEAGIEAAKVGAFLILAGDAERLALVSHVDAIFYLDDLDALHTWLQDNGAEILHGPRDVTAGRNLTARHPDGLVVEYFQAA
jgi:predicted enzyme related to lactoylglutathione lyase